MLRDVAALSAMDGRRAGTPAEEQAKAYVRAQLRSMQLEPRETAANVWALVEGSSDEVIVIGAHLDHLGPGYPGADDGGGARDSPAS